MAYFLDICLPEWHSFLIVYKYSVVGAGICEYAWKRLQVFVASDPICVGFYLVQTSKYGTLNIDFS